MPDSSSPVISAGLYSRLAEAADGFRDGKYHYFVCKPNFPYELKDVSADNPADALAAAEDLLEELNKGKPSNEFFKFGVYCSPLELARPLNYDFIRISFMQSSTVVYTKDLPPDADAVIFGIEAFDKFMYRYYKRLYGKDKADDIRAAVVDILRTPPSAPTGPTFRLMVPHARSTLLYDVRST